MVAVRAGSDIVGLGIWCRANWQIGESRCLVDAQVGDNRISFLSDSFAGESLIRASVWREWTT